MDLTEYCTMSCQTITFNFIKLDSAKILSVCLYHLAKETSELKNNGCISYISLHINVSLIGLVHIQMYSSIVTFFLYQRKISIFAFFIIGSTKNFVIIFLLNNHLTLLNPFIKFAFMDNTFLSTCCSKGAEVHHSHP